MYLACFEHGKLGVSWYFSWMIHLWILTESWEGVIRSSWYFHQTCGHITGIWQNNFSKIRPTILQIPRTKIFFKNGPLFAQKFAEFDEILHDDPAHEAHVLPKFEGSSLKFERMRAIQILLRKIIGIISPRTNNTFHMKWKVLIIDRNNLGWN